MRLSLQAVRGRGPGQRSQHLRQAPALHPPDGPAGLPKVISDLLRTARVSRPGPHGIPRHPGASGQTGIVRFLVAEVTLEIADHSN